VDLMTSEMDNSKSVIDWLNSCKPSVKDQYTMRWAVWIQYAKTHGLPINGDLQLEDMKLKRNSSDNETKFFYDNVIPQFYNWILKDYKSPTAKQVSDSTALGTVNAVRSFFSYHRYPLQIKKGALPSSEKVKTIMIDHAFTVYELRNIAKIANLAEKTCITAGVNLALRVGDFEKLDRETVQLAIKREEELAVQEKRDLDVVEFEIITEKESEPACCHLSHEAIEMVNDYLKTYPQKNGHLFPYQEDNLNDILKRLSVKAGITLGKNERVRWHCLRKFFITVCHGKVTEPVLKYMVGKHISTDLKTYIQANSEAKKAFKLIEPLISLTKTNGNGGNTQLAKQLEELKSATFKQLALMKLMEKITPKEEMQKAIIELAEEFGIKLKTKTKIKSMGEGGNLETYEATEIPDLNTFISEVGKAIEKADLERILQENGNNEH
jgi:integrase